MNIIFVFLFIFVRVFQKSSFHKKILDAVSTGQSKVFVIGLPKTGTTSLHAFFKCGGLSSSHWRCGGQTRCGECIKSNIQRGRPPVQGCGDFDVYAQMDVNADGNHPCYFPQIDALDVLYTHYPTATYIFNTRPFEHWNRSIHRWHGMNHRLRYKCEWPFVQSNDTDFFRRLHQQVRLHAESFKFKHPEMHIMFLDIESNKTSLILNNEFGISKECWGQQNKWPGRWSRDNPAGLPSNGRI